MLDIHVGIRRDELKPFRRIMDKQFEAHNELATMEDRWEEWGQIWVDEDSDHDDIIHVIIRTDVPMITLQFLVGAMMVFLNEISNEDNPFCGRFIIVTDHDQWTQFYHELSYPE